MIAGTPTDQTVILFMPIGSSVALNDRYMQWTRIWRKQVSLEEKWSIAGEKKFNHQRIRRKHVLETGVRNRRRVAYIL